MPFLGLDDRDVLDPSKSPFDASALFSWIEVLGLQEATVHLTDRAIRRGVAALPAEVGISVSGRGERI